MPLTRQKPLKKTKPLFDKKPQQGRSKGKRAVIRKCDLLFSKIVRARAGKCEWCGTGANLHCSHVIPRTSMGIRCDYENAICLCYHCHMQVWHKNPLAAHRWFEGQFPGRFDRLLEKQRATQGKKIDWESVLVSLERDAAQMG